MSLHIWNNPLNDCLDEIVCIEKKVNTRDTNYVTSSNDERFQHKRCLKISPTVNVDDTKNATNKNSSNSWPVNANDVDKYDNADKCCDRAGYCNVNKTSMNLMMMQWGNCRKWQQIDYTYPCPIIIYIDCYGCRKKSMC